MKVAVRCQIAVMKKLGEKFMSDKGTDDDDNSVLIKRSLPWQSSALNKLILKLDCACLKKKDNSKPSKKRVDESWSNRAQSVNTPVWAVVQIDETPTAGNSDIISEREQLVDSGNDADESALNTSIYHLQTPFSELSHSRWYHAFRAAYHQVLNSSWKHPGHLQQMFRDSYYDQRENTLCTPFP